MVADTVIVITRAEDSGLSLRDTVPAAVAFLAAVIAGVAAWWGTRNQTRVAEEGIAAQKAVSLDGLVAQREISYAAALHQTELARRDRVVQSRREWIGDLRRTVSDFERHAQRVHDSTQGNVVTQSEAQHSRAEMLRLETYLALLLDDKRDEHAKLLAAANAVSTWAQHQTKLGSPPTAGEAKFLTNARAYGGYATALAALDTAARNLIEQAWTKVKAGE